MAATCGCSIPPLSLHFQCHQQVQVAASLPRIPSHSPSTTTNNTLLPSTGCNRYKRCIIRSADPSPSLAEGVFSSKDKTDSGNLGRRETFLALITFAISLGQNATMSPLASFGSEEKKKRLTIGDIKNIIENDIKVGQYYVTGNLTRSIYNDKCRFVDPTTDIEGVDKYIGAVSQLFDPKASKQKLLSIEVTGPKTIKADWRLGGFLKFPWRPFIQPYEGSTLYSLDEQGLIVRHDETWNISILTAFLEFLSPSWLLGSEEQLIQSFV